MIQNNDIYDQYEGLVRSILKKYSNCINARISYEDLEQEAWVGVILGLSRYDPAKGFAISTFLYEYINGVIKTFITKNKSEFTTLAKDWDSDTPKTVSLDAPISDGDNAYNDILYTMSTDDHNGFEIIESARGLANNEKQFEMWKEWALRKYSVADIAKRHGMTRQRAHIIIRKLNGKIREHLK